MSYTTPKKNVSEVERIYRARESRARKKHRNHPAEWVETERVRPVLRAWLTAFERENNANAVTGTKMGSSVGSIGAREALAFRAGLSVRTLWRILDAPPKYNTRADRPPVWEGGERFLSLDTVDRLFLAMGCEGLFHVQPTNAEKTDGFADVYFHPSIMDDAEQSEEADDRFDRALALAGVEALDKIREAVDRVTASFKIDNHDDDKLIALITQEADIREDEARDVLRVLGFVR